MCVRPTFKKKRHHSSTDDCLPHVVERVFVQTCPWFLEGIVRVRILARVFEGVRPWKNTRPMFWGGYYSVDEYLPHVLEKVPVHGQILAPCFREGICPLTNTRLVFLRGYSSVDECTCLTKQDTKPAHQEIRLLIRIYLDSHWCGMWIFHISTLQTRCWNFIKSWKTSAVSTTDWMVKTQLCKLRGTSAYSIFHL